MTKGNDAIPQNDLRAFIAAVEKRGELAHVPGAHWDRELGAVAEVLYRQKVEKSPMLLFDDIPDYPKNYRCLYGMFGSPFRLALALGMEPSLSDNRKDMLDHFRKHIKKGFKRIAPEFVNEGPVLENVVRDNAVDMLKFPGADPSRRGWRALYRHGLRCRHPRSRHRPHQRRTYRVQVKGRIPAPPISPTASKAAFTATNI